MQSILLTLLLPAILICTISCSKDPITSNSLPPKLPHLEPIPFETQEELINSVQTHQFKASSAPEALAILFPLHQTTHEGKTTFYRSQCSSFLIASNLLATNAHCVPAEIRYEGANCENRMVALFMDQEIANCKRVRAVTNLNDYSYEQVQDLAIIELSNHVTKKPLAYSTNGALENEALTIYALTPNDLSGLSTEVKIKKCSVVVGSRLNRQFVAPTGRNLLLSDCQIEPGNSGSPIVNQHGKVVGIAQGTFHLVKSYILSELESREGITLTDLADLGIGTSFSCIKNSVVSQKLSPLCLLTPTQSERINQKGHAILLQKAFEKFKERLPSDGRQYAYKEIGKNQIEIYSPESEKVETHSLHTSYDDRVVFEYQITGKIK